MLECLPSVAVEDNELSDTDPVAAETPLPATGAEPEMFDVVESMATSDVKALMCDSVVDLDADSVGQLGLFKTAPPATEPLAFAVDETTGMMLAAGNELIAAY